MCFSGPPLYLGLKGAGPSFKRPVTERPVQGSQDTGQELFQSVYSFPNGSKRTKVGSLFGVPVRALYSQVTGTRHESWAKLMIYGFSRGAMGSLPKSYYRLDLGSFNQIPHKRNAVSISLCAFLFARSSLSLSPSLAVCV